MASIMSPFHRNSRGSKHRCRPGESRDPYRGIYRGNAAGRHHPPNEHPWLWAPGRASLARDDNLHHSGGSIASSYSFLKRATSSVTGRIFSMLPMPWPLPQISFHAFGLARSPEASVPKFILEGSEVSRLSGSMPAATIDGLR